MSIQIIIDFTKRVLKSKGYTFIGNLLILCFFIWLKFSSIEETRRIFGNIYLFARNLLPFFIFGLPILLGSKLINKIFFAIFILIFILGEGLTRVGLINNLAITNWDDSNLYRYPKPYVEFLGKPNSSIFYSPYSKMGGSIRDANISLNDLGFRGALPKKNKGNEFRIIMLGGSTVFNGVPLSKSIPGELEQLFYRDGFGNVKVYNWGVVSFNSGQELSLLVHYASDFDPDLVLVYDGANDIYHSYAFESRPGYPYNWQTYEAGLKIIRDGPDISQILNMIVLQSRLITSVFGESLRNRIVEAKHQTPLSNEEEDYVMNTTTDAYLSNLKKMCDFSKGNNSKFIAVLQPMLVFKRPLVGKENKLLGENGIQLQSYIKKSYQLLNNSYLDLEKKNEKGECYYADLSKIFLSYDKEIYWDIVHTNNDGNQFIAAQIYNTIKNNFQSLKIQNY